MSLKKKGIILACVAVVIVFFLLQYRSQPETISYGMSFSEFKARKLNLDPKATFDALVYDMGVRTFRLSSHWPIVEPERNQYDFSFLDYQIKTLEEVGGKAIVTLGRRQPAWPECHIPYWVGDMPTDEKYNEIKELITETVKRYKDSPAVEYWQVENEPFLSAFATDECGPLDRDFFKSEIDLVKSLDGSREVLVTDSGNIGTWFGAYKAGDLFGTSLYRYFWTPELGIFESKLPAAFYRVKYNMVSTLLGRKPSFLIELAGEPWLTQKIVDTDIEVQISRMTPQMLKGSIDFASRTGFDRQYLWGGEWWYYMKSNSHPEYWNYAKTLFTL